MEKKPPILFIILLIFYLINSNTVSCQIKTEKDSLNDYSLKKLSKILDDKNLDSINAVRYAKAYINKAKFNKDTFEIAIGLFYLSSINKDTSLVVNYWKNVIDNTKRSNNKIYPTAAYIALGDIYIQRGEHNNALKNYLSADKLLHVKKNDSLYYLNMLRIGIIKGRQGFNKESLMLLKKVYNYFTTKKSKNYSSEYYTLLLQISSRFNYMKVYDSALYYNKKAQIRAIKLKDTLINAYIIYMQGQIEFKKRNYNIAILNFKKSLPFLIKDRNYTTISSSYAYIGRSYDNINSQLNSKLYFNKVDSLKTNNIFFHRSQKPAYKFLISYYKEKNNDEKQLEYINKYIELDSVLNARAKSVTRNLTDNFDIPNLLAERKRIENSLKVRLSTTKKWIIGISSFAFIILLFLIQQNRRRKLYKKRFQQLINSSKSLMNEKTTIKKGQLISEEIIESISTHLIQFEKNQKFISSEITLHSLAKTFETNSKYLSQFINQQKEQSFNNYMNRLRINFTIEKLKDDSRFRKYSIKAIANEVGFNTSESFSKSFYKNTGIKPSYFIKELEKK